MKLPYRTRDPRSFRDIAERLLREKIDCGSYMLDCSLWRSINVEYVDRRVYDRLSGLRLRLRIPVLHLRGDSSECRIEARWDGEWFRLECRDVEKCCRRVTRGP